jgi:ABC-type transporter Mla MlaB component
MRQLNVPALPPRLETMPKRSTAAARPKRESALALAADCRVSQVDELKAKLSRALAQKAPVVLDASAVKQVDAAGLQLLAAFVRERQAKDRTVEWRDPSPPLVDAARRLGLAAMLRLEPT